MSDKYSFGFHAARSRVLLLGLALAFLAIPALSGQSNALEWYGPQSFVLGPQYSGGESPYSDAANPAASSWIQRLTFDISYLLTAGLETEQGTAHQINLGASIPSNLGVFSFSGGFATSDLPSFALGTYGTLNAAFSKDILDELGVGLGLQFQYGASAAGLQDWGLGLDLGFINRVGDVAFLRDFAWGASLKGLGKAMNLGFGPWPTTFTPGVGTQFKLIKEKDVSLGFNFDLDFPMVADPDFRPNLQFNAGLDFGLFNLVKVMVGYDLDVQRQIAGTDRSFPMNFGVSLNLGGAKSSVDADGKPLPFWSTSEYKPTIVAAPFRNGLWTFGAGLNMPIGVVDATPPVIKVETPEEVWISPNFDGVQDNLDIPVQITDERYIAGYTLYIYDEKGNLVRVIKSKEDRPENKDIGTLLDRFARVKSGIAVPDTVQWDGQGGQAEATPAPSTMPEPSPSPAPAGQAGPSSTGQATVTPSPAPTVKPVSFFEGIPFLTLETMLGQTAGGTATPAPAAASPTPTPTPVPSPAAAQNFKAQPLPDGVYTYVIESIDDNGNKSRTTARIVHVDSTPPSLKLDPPADKGFAPGGDRPAFIFGQTTSAEDKWTAMILDSDGKVVRNFTWTRETGGLPAQGVWDGKNDKGELARDGLYSYVLNCTDRAGNKASATIDNIMLLNRPTPVNLLVDNAWFSPNGDNIKDTVFVSVDANRDVAVDSWTASLVDSNGIPVRTLTGTKELPKSITIDGKNDKGKVLPEGRYLLKLETLYVNGNKPTAQSPELVLDLTPPSLTLKTDYRLFSPDGDGQKDFVRIVHQQPTDEPLWTGLIKNAQGQEIQRYTWRGRPDIALDWDGKGTDNKALPDGTYTYQVSASDLAGNFGVSNSLEFRIDTRATAVSVTARQPAFSPNGDKVLDTQTFGFGLGLDSDIESWELKVISAGTASGTAVKSWSGTGRPDSDLDWDGKDSNGKVVSDGTYQAMAKVVYLKGNAPLVLSRTFVVDTKAPSLAMKTNIQPADSGKVFFPDVDRSQDSLTFMHDSSDEETWTAAILDSGGTAVKTYTYTGKMPAQVVWNGTDATGNRLKDGAYTYRVSSTDKAGNSLSQDIKGITLDTKPTPVTLNIAGSAFSPNADGTKDEMEFLPVLEQNSDIKSWTLSIIPAAGGSAWSRSGTSIVDPSVKWNGKTDGGRMAPEGEYVARLLVEYLKGKKVEASSPRFALDLTPPSAKAYASASLFSPDGDGQNDQVRINIEASKEPVWKGAVYFAGALGSRSTKPASTAPVTNWEWKNTPSSSLLWDGTSTQGVAVPDGDYLFVLSATDAAGNQGQSDPITLQVDKRPVALALAMADKAFSPNGDGRKDTLKLNVNAGTPDGIDSWLLNIRDAKSQAVRSISGKSELPKSFDWDGKDNQGKTAPEGDYSAELTVNYLKGNKPRAVTDTFTLDLTPPALTLRGEDLIFSPDGDSRKDVARIFQKSSAEELWEGKITDAKGKVIKSLYWKGEAKDFVWDGRDENGNKQDDGVYAWSITSTDLAGNVRADKISGITIDTRSASLLLSTSSRGFAPGSTVPNQGSIAFRPFLSLKDGVDSWTLEFQINNEKIHSINGKGLPPEVITWDGFMGTGAGRKMAPEGRYEALLAVEYTKGTRPEARSTPFVLDVSAPDVKIAIAPAPFSPDEDGVDDEVTIGLNVDDPSGIKDWELKIMEPSESGVPGKVFASFSGTGQPTSRIVWYGKSSTGELVQAAEDYPVVLTITDSLGNKGVYDKEKIAVDVLVLREADGTLRIKIPGISFPSNSANLKGVDAEKLLKNSRTLERIAQILRKYASYKIGVEGHANITRYWDKALAEKEQKEELLPLSQQRAEAVMQALIDLGIPASRLTAIGVGGARPVVPNNDKDNVWKNRRVEFILRK